MQDALGRFLETKFAIAADVAGFPVDKTKMVLMLLFCYVLAFVHGFIPRTKGLANLHHVYSLACGLYMGWLMFGYDVLHTVFTSTFCYLLLMFLSPKNVGITIFVFMMSYLLACHSYRLYTDPGGWSMDFTGSQMLLTLKLTSLGFSWSDGHLKDKSKLDSYQRQYQVTKRPSILEFYAWCYFYLGFLAGPAFELLEYQQFVNNSMFTREIKEKKLSSMPSGRFVAAFKSFIEAVLCITVFVLLGNIVSPETLKSEAYLFKYTVLAKILMMWLMAVRWRFQYYFAWCLSNGSSQLAGIGFSGVDENNNNTWDRGNNVNIVPCETAGNIKMLTDNWNLRVDRWLKHHIYARANNSKTLRKYGVMLTLLTSALWHGVYAGYYMAFLSAALIVETMRMGRRVIRPMFVDTPLKPLYDVFTMVGSAFLLNYTMIPFPLLWMDDGIRFWKSLNFSGHIICIVLYIVFFAMGGSKKSAKKPAPSTTHKSPTTQKGNYDQKHVDTPMPRKKRSN